MPQSYLYRDAVKNALIQDGWVVTDDPFIIGFKGLRLCSDLSTEKVLGAEKQKRQIAVDIKVFNNPSLVCELEKAIGQYTIYRACLKQVYPQRELYLAVGQDIYQDFFLKHGILEIIVDMKMKLLIFEPISEEIIQWII